MAQISDLVEPLFVYSGSAPDELLITKYRDAARRFFRDTRAWRFDVVTITQAVGDTSTYDLTVPTDSEAFDFNSPVYDELPIPKMTREQTKARKFPATGSPGAIRLGAMNQVILSPDPGADASALLSIRAVLRPTRTADTLDDDLADQFAEFIEYGALETLLRMPKEDWTDLTLSAYYRGLFIEGVDTTRARASTGMMAGTRGTVRYGGL
ncbi:MAG TPA: hypothetical protein VLA11_04855 [Woeseiaceae bacterium]|nr:hypothetical protein [Woeseiaceae bacterium]